MRASYTPKEAAQAAVAYVKKETDKGVVPMVAINRVASEYGIDPTKLSDLYFNRITVSNN